MPVTDRREGAECMKRECMEILEWIYVTTQSCTALMSGGERCQHFLVTPIAEAVLLLAFLSSMFWFTPVLALWVDPRGPGAQPEMWLVICSSKTVCA